jgi:hypothetical protein
MSAFANPTLATRSVMTFRHPLSSLAALLLVFGCAGDAEPDATGRTEADSGLDASAGATTDTVPRLIASLEGFEGPEAVKYDPDQDVYFVANFGAASDEPRDGNGYISRVGPEGEIVAARFGVGPDGTPLHMPRGMALKGDTLWVADVDGIHGFDRRSGDWLAFVDFTAHEPGFLNDIDVGGDGFLYVTDTGASRVYRVRDGTAEIAVEDERTGPPNGITWDQGRGAFLLAPWEGGGGVVHAWSPDGGFEAAFTIEADRFDGIELMDGAVLVATQSDSTIWAYEDGAPRRLFRVDGAPADIGVDTQRGRVAVPYIALNRVDLWAIR